MLFRSPMVFGTTVDTVPWPGAYLGADDELAVERRAQFPNPGCDELAFSRPLRVGLAWAGNPRYKADRQRSMSLMEMMPLLRTPTVKWISLQKGPESEQLARLPGDVSVFDGASNDQNLAQTAALVAALDLVITTDTCIAHLAGAMGKPVWILLSHLSDWRWMQDAETTPWYPTARLFRQRTPGGWSGVLDRVIRALNESRTSLVEPQQ